MWFHKFNVIFLLRFLDSQTYKIEKERGLPDAETLGISGDFRVDDDTPLSRPSISLSSLVHNGFSFLYVCDDVS